MAYKQSLKAIPLTSVDYLTLNAALNNFVDVNTGGLPRPLSIIRIVNTMDVEVFISYRDGVTQDVISPDSTLEISYAGGDYTYSNKATIPVGTIVSASVTRNAGRGVVAVAGYYQGVS